LGFAAEKVKIAIDLDHGLLRGVFGIGRISQQRQEEEVNGALAGTNELVKEMFLTGLDAANALDFEFRVGEIVHGRMNKF
jgi:hypothetical protein